ncbi:hypothetical protein CHI07_17175 [Paenibacillus sp. 7884-2]|nr:hypothetical protein CHI07_17175 [Paenibacillus sp. 7884-2]
MRFTIKGDKDFGRYVVSQDGQELFEITEMHYGGLKEARQRIGSYLQAKGHSLNESFEHACVKPGRKNNPKLRWSVEEYLIGVPIKK